MTTDQFVSDFMAGHPSASFQDAKLFAAEQFSDNDERTQFLLKFWRLLPHISEIAVDVDRIWPDRKRY